MSRSKTALMLLAAFLGVFAEASLEYPRRWLGGSIDVLPPLMVYAALQMNLTAVGLLACCGGVWADSLSANPLVAGVLPLYTIGWVLHQRHEFILQELGYAQAILGMLASAAMPVLTLLMVLSLGHTPLLGWGSLWQWLVLTLGGGLLTPVCFAVLDRLGRQLDHPPARAFPYRADREIKRGRY